jgi:hypothetical protein
VWVEYDLGLTGALNSFFLYARLPLLLLLLPITPVTIELSLS